MTGCRVAAATPQCTTIMDRRFDLDRFLLIRPADRFDQPSWSAMDRVAGTPVPVGDGRRTDQDGEPGGPDPGLAVAAAPAVPPGTVLTTLSPTPLAQVLTGLQPTVQSRILDELPASELRQLAPSVLAKLPPSVLATLPTSVLAKLPPSVRAELPASVLAQLPVS